MNIFERLKQLKFIRPETSFTERSRREILSTQPSLTAPRMTVRQILARALEVTVAGALVALFVLVITGGVANSPLTPVPFAAVSPTALHAEAQAIDIQIQLTKLAYQASEATATAESTPSSNAPMNVAVPAGAAVAASSTGPSAPTSTLSVDQALQALTN